MVDWVGAFSIVGLAIPPFVMYFQNVTNPLLEIDEFLTTLGLVFFVACWAIAASKFLRSEEE